MTELKTPLTRALAIGRTRYKLTISPQGFKLVLKGKRNGLEISWQDLVNGDAAMAVALRASLQAPIATARPQTARAGKRSAGGKRLH